MTAAATNATSRTIPKPRAPQFPFGEVPKRWFQGSALATHIANGANLLFPAGERFFVRSVRHYVKAIEDDPVLLEQVRGFFGQEGRHAGTHEKQFEVLEAQGFELGAFMRVYETIAYRWIERLSPPALNLAATVAAEHFTAIMAENAFKLGLLEDADPVMRRFLLWHAAEEIEHRAVAFDVLAKVNPSYALRMAGLGMATVMLASFWAAGTLVLLKQDGITWRELRAERRELEKQRAARGGKSIAQGVFARGIREYLRRDFHPSDNPMDAYAREFLEGAGLA
jgi:predicted metal-dependent hydrolase